MEEISELMGAGSWDILGSKVWPTALVTASVHTIPGSSKHHNSQFILTLPILYPLDREATSKYFIP